MINHNLLMYSLFDRTMTIDVWGKIQTVNYMEGDLYELAKKLEEYNRSNVLKFPLIWLIDGYDVVRDSQKRTSKLESCHILFITSAVLEDRNKQRFETTFKDMLYRLLVMFDKKITVTKGISKEIVDRIRAYPLKDMLKESKPSSTEDPVLSGVWDALLLVVDIEINNDCFPQFKIKI